jgi:predicted RecA/RadA family phage recombinase
MKVYQKEGEVINVAAPYAVSAGEPFAVGSLFVVAITDLASGEVGACSRLGVFELPKLSTDANAVGEKLNWDAVNKYLKEATSTLDGVATVVEAAGASTTVVKCVLTPV